MFSLGGLGAAGFLVTVGAIGTYLRVGAAGVVATGSLSLGGIGIRGIRRGFREGVDQNKPKFLKGASPLIFAICIFCNTTAGASSFSLFGSGTAAIARLRRLLGRTSFSINGLSARLLFIGEMISFLAEVIGGG